MKILKIHIIFIFSMIIIQILNRIYKENYIFFLLFIIWVIAFIVLHLIEIYFLLEGENKKIILICFSITRLYLSLYYIIPLFIVSNR